MPQRRKDQWRPARRDHAAWSNPQLLQRPDHLTLRELQAPLDVIDCTALDHAELEQIRHWRPSTAGELIFNYWAEAPLPSTRSPQPARGWLPTANGLRYE